MEDYLGLNTWLSQKAMARILGVSQQDISVHARSILEDNEEYGSIFVRRIATNGGRGRKVSKKYYHQFLLEMIASKVRTVASRNFLSLAKACTKRNLSLQMRLITD